jgi:hypothetical protein
VAWLDRSRVLLFIGSSLCQSRHEVPRRQEGVRLMTLLANGLSPSYRISSSALSLTAIQEYIMAKTKTKKPSKSALIRETLIAAPDRPAVEVAKQFGVKPSLVYNVKTNMKKKAGKPKGKPGRKPGSKHASNGAAPHAAHVALDTAFDFVVKVGGLLHAEQLIAKLKSIKEKL